MRAERVALMPDWPVRMTAEVAAMFMCVSESTFLTRFRHLGRKEGSNVFWARQQLEAIVAEQFGLRTAGTERDTSWDDLA